MFVLFTNDCTQDALYPEMALIYNKISYFARQMRKKADYTEYQQALSTLQHFCAYQDRCHQDARDRLADLGVYGERAEQIIADLIAEKYLDEERFARSFARGKFRMKKWGKLRITQALKQRKISDYCIRKALTEIDEAAYTQVLGSELERRNQIERKAKHPYLRRRKLADYMVKRGFEPALVWYMLDELEIGKE